MKLIIEIPDKDYEKLKDGHIPFSILDVMQNGTPIPDNATNGDMIKAMFPNVDIVIHNITVYMIFDMRSNAISFDLNWWNAPYKAESEVMNDKRTVNESK